MAAPGILPAAPEKSALAASPGAAASYGPFARWLLRRLFEPVAFPVEEVPKLQQAAQATPVYVLRSSSLLHLLYFNWTFAKLGLPIARAATGLGYRIFVPFARWYLGGPQIKAKERGEIAQVVEAVRRGEAAMVFLRAPRTLPSAVSTLSDPFPALLELQRAQPQRPIALVPLTFLWRKRPKRLGGSLRDAIFGNPEEPGAIRTFLGYLSGRKNAYVKVGEPVLLTDVEAMNRDSEPERVARRVRGWLHQHLARETRVVTGPPLKPPARVIEETLRDLSLRRALAEIASEKGRDAGSVEEEARKDLREIAARYNPLIVDLLKRFLNFVFNRIYDGVDVDEAGMRRLVEASRKAPLILCPCHKSHIDYMILSMICDDYGLQPPHVAAGDNLNFWPVGRLLRAGGAFFIRRSFKGDRIYSATMGAYVKRLLQDGFTQEFFIEGGRSRTGKLLPPKFGMLTLEVDAWLTGVRPDAYFAPVSLSYEKIVEARSYQRELLGGEKQKEDAKALLGATRILRSRYGRITIRVDEPISVAQLFRERGVDPKACTPEEKKRLVQHLGLRIAAGINAAAPLSPIGLASAALLSHDRRALAESELLDRADFLHAAALDCGAHADRESPRPLVLKTVDSLCADGTLRRHEAGGERFYALPEERRMVLDYHKNSILHFLVAPAILSAALRSFRGQAAPLPELMRRAKDASRLLKYEFIYPPGKSFESTVDETFALLFRWGLVEKSKGDAVQPVARGLRMMALLAELLRPFGEAVWVTADALRLLLPGPMAAKEWTRLALDKGQAAYLAGRILRLEALSKPTLENALAMFRDRGVVIGARLKLTSEWASADKLASLAEEADLFLR
jgi:glycerol-3-phosphate O-acyltransferase